MAARRLFVGAFPPPAVAEAVHRAVSETLAAADFRLVPPEELHLTFRFLGATEEDAIEAIGRDLERSLRGTPAVEGIVRKTGAFPGVERAKVLWAGVEDREGRLRTLVPEEDWTPHLTVARSAGRGRVPAPAAFLEVALAIPWILDEVRLVESRPGSTGPDRFPTIASFRLSRDSV
jgi:2'-5' RNA ligase